MTYDEAVATLYQAPFADFVPERKRLSAELKAAGDKEGAARVAKLTRPPVSAWVVNQLWWQARDAFDAFIQVAARVKTGDRESSRLHKEALSKLRERATRMLQAGGNVAADTTLRRVTTTLSAVAASGGFAPDPPGALSADRDPPGFEALGFASTAAVAPEAERRGETEAEQRAAEAQQRVAEAQQRAEEAEKRRVEAEERSRRLAERERLSTALHEARALQTSQQRELSRLRSDVEAAEQSLKKTQALLAELETQLTSL